MKKIQSWRCPIFTHMLQRTKINSIYKNSHSEETRKRRILQETRKNGKESQDALYRLEKMQHGIPTIPTQK